MATQHAVTPVIFYCFGCGRKFLSPRQLIWHKVLAGRIGVCPAGKKKPGVRVP